MFIEESRLGLKKQEILVLLSGLLILVVLILVSDRPPFYDEDDYLSNVALIHKYGFSRLYLENHIGSAGPLYPALHYLLEPLTQLNTPHVRLVNVLLLIGSVCFIGQTLKALRFPRSYSFLALAVPMTYVISGLALTEIPAIFFLSASLYLLIRVCHTSLSFPKAAILVSAAGLLLSLAILGRQPFLLVVGALPFLILGQGRYLKNSFLLLLTCLCALAIPLYVFSIWGGLVAPRDASLYDALAENGTSLQPVFFFICMAYYAFVFLLVTPNFYMSITRKELLALAILALISVGINSRYDLIQYLPMKYLIEEIFPPVVVAWAGIICGAGLILGTLFFMLILVRQLIKNKFAPALLFFTVSIVVIAISCIKITWGFSSRYPAQALPFLVPMFAYFYKDNKFNSYRLGIGVSLGLISFASFMSTE